MNVTRYRWGAAGMVVGTVILVSAVSVGTANAATTYVVNNTVACSDAGPGTPAQPFCTIGAAAAKAVAGDTVLVSGGPYTGTSVNPANSGTSTSVITFQASPGTAIVGGTKGFALSGRSNIMISGFTITGTSSYGISVSGGGNILIANNKVSFAGNPVPGSAAEGIILSNVAGGRVLNNITHNNSAHGIDLIGTTTGFRVQGNRSYLNAYEYQRNAVGINVTAPGNNIVHNFTYKNEDTGINVYPGANYTIVTGNVSFENGDHGIDNHNVTGGHITGNTVWRNCTSGINIEGTSNHFIIDNNVSMNNATGAIINPTPINPPGAYVNNCNRRVGNIGVYDSAPATTSTNFNEVWQTGTGAEYVWADKTYQTQRALNLATGREARGIFANPKFANLAAWNFQLTGSSPAIDSANSAAPNEQYTDIIGEIRFNDPYVPNTGAGPRTYDDRGAYEFHL